MAQIFAQMHPQKQHNQGEGEGEKNEEKRSCVSLYSVSSIIETKPDGKKKREIETKPDRNFAHFHLSKMSLKAAYTSSLRPHTLVASGLIQ
jgi:hypothetical protein